MGECFHCSEPLPEKNPQAFAGAIGGETVYFCCPACRTVAETIEQLGLGRYYRERDDKSPLPASVAGSGKLDQNAHLDADLPANRSRFLTALADGRAELRCFIPDIHCASCCWLIERHLQSLPEVERADVRLDNHELRAIVSADSQVSHLLVQLAAIGYRALPWQPTLQQQASQDKQRGLLYRLGLAGILAMQIHMIAMGQYFGASDQVQLWLNEVALLLSLPLWFYCATPFFAGAWRNIKQLWLGITHRSSTLLTASMDLPVTLAIIAAAIASLIGLFGESQELYFDSISMFVFLLLGARYWEAQARAKLAVQAQMPQLPDSCWLAGERGAERIAIAALQAGDSVLVRAGEIIPVDGHILHGQAVLDQSILTGESLPIEVTAGDKAIAGASVVSGELTIKAQAWAEDSHLAKLHQRIEQALSRKQQHQFYDTVAKWFTPVVILLAALGALYWWAIEPSKAMPVFLAVLVASCPCALSLAIPTATTATTLYLKKHGIVISASHVLDLLPKLAAVAFDKTGTLTQGRMSLLRCELFAELTEQQALNLAANLEHSSAHPIASAFQQQLSEVLPLTDLTQHVHAGVSASYQGAVWRLGKANFALGEAPMPAAGSSAELTVVLSRELQPVAIFYLGDELRDDAESTIAKLRQKQLPLAIITGDHSAAAERIAQQLHIEQLVKNASPEQKMAAVDQLKAQYGTLLMVGDGVNDGPVLAHADISATLAEASHTAHLAADVVLLNNRLNDLLVLHQQSLRLRRIIRQNLFWALLYNLSVMPLAVIGWLPPVVAAIGMAISSLVVTVNSLRLLK